MPLTRWIDDGIAIVAELSTSGPLIIGGRQTEYPFATGGPSGIPLGWSLYLWGTGAAASDVNLTTDAALNRFSISNALASNQNRQYGATFRFDVVAGHSYRIGVQARTMEGKDANTNFAFQASGIRANGSNAGILGFAYSQKANTDWTDYAIQTGVIAADIVRVEVLLASNASPLTGAINWGGQFTGFFQVETVPDSEVEPTTWRDITCDIQSTTIRYGRERYTNRYDVGTCSLVIQNDQGEYSYREPHPFGLRPGRLVKLKAIHAGVTYPLFYGVLDSISDAYTLGGHAFVSFSCFDPSQLFSNITPTTLSGPIPYGGERIARLLDLIGYRPRALDVGQWYMQNIVDSDRSVRDEMGVTADSEGGAIFADREGRIVYKDRTWQTVDDDLRFVSAQLSARPHDDNLPIVDGIPTQADAPTVCPFEMNTNWALDRMINHVELAYAGGTAQLFDDKESQKQFGVYSYQRLDYVLYSYYANLGGYLAIRANELMSGYSEPRLRVNSLTFRPGINPECWPWTLSVFLNWLVRVWYANPINLWGYAIVTHVQSIEHRITTNEWETALTLDQPISYANAPITDVTDHWGRAKWEISLWRRARFTQLARFNLSVWEHNAGFDNAKFDVDHFV